MLTPVSYGDTVSTPHPVDNLLGFYFRMKRRRHFAVDLTSHYQGFSRLFDLSVDDLALSLAAVVQERLPDGLPNEPTFYLRSDSPARVSRPMHAGIKWNFSLPSEHFAVANGQVEIDCFHTCYLLQAILSGYVGLGCTRAQRGPHTGQPLHLHTT